MGAHTYVYKKVLPVSYVSKISVQCLLVLDPQIFRSFKILKMKLILIIYCLLK